MHGNLYEDARLMTKVYTLVIILLSVDSLSPSFAISLPSQSSEQSDNQALAPNTEALKNPSSHSYKSTWSNKAQVLRVNYHSQPRDAYEDILAAEKNFVTRVEQAEYYLLLAEASAKLNLFNKTQEYSISGLVLIDVHSEPWLYHYLRLYEAQAFDQLGNTSAGVYFAEAAMLWAENNQSNDLLLIAYLTRGIQYLTLGKNDEAMNLFQLASDLTEMQQLAFSAIDVTYYMAYVYEYTGQDELAYTEYKLLRELTKGGPNKVLFTKATYGMGRAAKNINRLDEGFSLLKAAITNAEKIGLTQYSAYANKELSGYYLIKNQPDDAIRVLEIAKRLFEESENPYMLMDVNFTLGRVGLQKQDPDMAEAYLQKAQEYIQSDSMRPHQLALDFAKVELLSLRGDTTGALNAMKVLYKDYRNFVREQNIRELHELSTLYKLEKSQSQNDYLQQRTQVQQMRLEQQKQNTIYASLAVSVVFLSLLALYFNTRKHSRMLEQLNNTDALTQLASRRYIMSRIGHAAELAKRYNQTLSIASVDLDHFKQINDGFGHDVGDSVLERFGEICRAHFRNTDLLGRVGGEEFLFCFSETSRDQAVKALEKLGEKIKNDILIIRYINRPLTLSAGVIEFDVDEALDSNLAKVDRCLYVAKENGRDQVQVA
ncbi:GGDEF domain-containing protein [Glaciecola sp. MH2013]|uniref:tetratricopeptide repeat-containing diguanylate cyclase n=1 Tax=Glaciecola sp. MH2013 TaxID=2785524 RepID=UPI00189ED2A0|nr:GGDEF domain-containing protein [Glaciecola sp. MH2013]MBF7073754.1 GGDEF domain-containing protein [Glaciecola sp. MH2013]